MQADVAKNDAHHSSFGCSIDASMHQGIKVSMHQGIKVPMHQGINA
jgi:hypothetical protein